MAGLARLRVNLDGEQESAPIRQLFKITLNNYLMQVTLYWLIPLIVLLYGFWPFTFFYLIFIIQYREFKLQNKIIDQILRLPHLLTIALMRCLFLFCRGSENEKKEFKDEYLNFNQIFSSEKYVLQKTNSVKNPNNFEPSERNYDPVSDENNRLTMSNQEQTTHAKYRPINLSFLQFVETLCLGAMTIIMGFGLLVFYLRANY